MIDENLFPADQQANLRFFSLFSSRCLGMYDDMRRDCSHVRDLMNELDELLVRSYCGEQYDKSIESVAASLQVLANDYGCNRARSDPKVPALLTSLRDNIVRGAPEWDYRSCLEAQEEIGIRLAQDFYRAGARAESVRLLANPISSSRLSNGWLSDSSSGDIRPMKTVSGIVNICFHPDAAHLYWYFSYPMLFFHEFASHVFVPNILSTRFEDGWLVYAIHAYARDRCVSFAQEQGLDIDQLTVFADYWRNRFTGPAAAGFDMAEDFHIVVGGEKFFDYTWDLAACPFDSYGSDSVHDTFLDRLTPHLTRGALSELESMCRSAGSAFDLLARLEER